MERQETRIICIVVEQTFQECIGYSKVPPAPYPKNTTQIDGRHMAAKQNELKNM